MVLRQVGKGGHVIAHAIDAMQRQCMTGHLHGARVHTTLKHHGEQGMQVCGLRGGPNAFDAVLADARLDSPDQPRHPPEGAQRRVKQVGRRRLAICTGDPQHGQCFAGASVDHCRNGPQDGAGLWNHQHRHRDLVEREQCGSGRIGQHGNRPEADCCSDEARTMNACPWKGRIQVSRPDAARVQGHPGHHDARVDDSITGPRKTDTLSH